MNLIGEHTDYNEVFVLPLAIDRATWIVLRARNDTTVRLHSPEHKETSELTDADLKKGPTSWSKYPKGVTWALREDGYELRGWEGVSACAQIVSLAVKSTSNSPILSHAVNHGEENRREVIGRHPKCCEKTPREWTKQ